MPGSSEPPPVVTTRRRRAAPGRGDHERRNEHSSSRAASSSSSDPHARAMTSSDTGADLALRPTTVSNGGSEAGGDRIVDCAGQLPQAHRQRGAPSRRRRRGRGDSLCAQGVAVVPARAIDQPRSRSSAAAPARARGRQLARVVRHHGWTPRPPGDGCRAPARSWRAPSRSPRSRCTVPRLASIEPRFSSFAPGVVEASAASSAALASVGLPSSRARYQQQAQAWPGSAAVDLTPRQRGPASRPTEKPPANPRPLSTPPRNSHPLLRAAQPLPRAKTRGPSTRRASSASSPVRINSAHH